MKRSSHTSGFTLVELLVSTALFLVVMTTSVGTLLTLVDANRKAQSLKTAMDNVQFALDGVSRNIRTGYDITCDAPGGGAWDGDCDGGDAVRFISDDGCEVIYELVVAEEAIYRTMNGGDPGCPDDSGLPLTADKVSVSGMKFWVTGTEPGSPDDEQPTVTIAIQGTTKIDPNIDTDFNIQTTVVQRVLDL